MIGEMLKAATPDLVIQAVRSNPQLILQTLQKFEAFHVIGSYLTEEQQLCVSKNLARFNDFLKSDTGRAGVKELADRFVAFTKPVS